MKLNVRYELVLNQRPERPELKTGLNINNWNENCGVLRRSLEWESKI